MSEAIGPILVVTVLILLNGLFVASEFAIVGAPRPALEHRAAQGDRRARMVTSILGDARRLDRFIATAQLGITLASVGLGMYGEHLLAAWLAGVFESLGPSRWIAAHTLGSITAIAILTYFHIVVGEMVPKSLALQRAETMVRWIVPVMLAVEFAVLPLVVALNGIGNFVLRLMGIRRDARTAEFYQTPEELAYLVHESQRGGLIRSEPARVVSELLDFGQLTASEVMVPRVSIATIPIGATASEVVSLVHERPFTRYPVVDGTVDRIVGMLHVKDILRCMPGCEPLRRDQVRPLPYVPVTATMDQVMSAMRQSRSQMAVVLDEHGGTAGMITSEDLFEEVVGDVGDDVTGRPEVIRIDSTSVHAVGVARLEAVGDALGIKLVHEEVDTVGGLVFTILGRPPRIGESVDYGGLRITVTETHGHGVARVLASLLSSARGPRSSASPAADTRR
jgi:CBS domain containing-hemolysin-like protein